MQFSNLWSLWPWPWPWIGSYGILSCISHRPLSTNQISLKSEKLFCGRTYWQIFQTPYNAIRSTRRSRPKKLEAKDVLPNINCTQAAENVVFCSSWPWPLTFKLVRAREQTRLRVKLAQIHSPVPTIFHTQTKKPQNDGAKNRTFCSSLRAVKINVYLQCRPLVILYLYQWMTWLVQLAS